MEIHSVGPYALGKTLGKGSTGKVKLGIHKETGAEVAIKIIRKDVLNTRPAMREKVEREIAILKLLQHPQILTLYDVYQSSQYLFLVLEHVKGGELFDYLVSKDTLDPAEALVFFRQIIRAVRFCHVHLICHRDLKPENLLLDEHNRIKIADFGMGSLMKQGTLLTTSCGSPHYASPEVILGRHYDGRAADIWSCGVILYALLTGRLPFDDDNIRRLLGKVKSGIFSMPYSLPKDAKDLLWRMLQVDPTKRIKIDEIIDHPFFRGSTPAFGLSSGLMEPVPLEMKVASPLPVGTEANSEIVKTLMHLGWSNEAEVRVALHSPEPDHIKVFYHLLYRRKFGIEDEEEEDLIGGSHGAFGVPGGNVAPPGGVGDMDMFEMDEDVGIGGAEDDGVPRDTPSPGHRIGAGMHSPPVVPSSGRTHSSPIGVPMGVPVGAGAFSPSSPASHFLQKGSGEYSESPRFHRRVWEPSNSPIIGSTPKKSWFLSLFGGASREPPRPERSVIDTQDLVMRTSRSTSIALQEMQRCLGSLGLPYSMNGNTFEVSAALKDGASVSLLVYVTQDAEGTVIGFRRVSGLERDFGAMFDYIRKGMDL